MCTSYRRNLTFFGEMMLPYNEMEWIDREVAMAYFKAGI
jgi:hypothetical protein